MSLFTPTCTLGALAPAACSISSYALLGNGTAYSSSQPTIVTSTGAVSIYNGAGFYASGFGFTVTFNDGTIFTYGSTFSITVIAPCDSATISLSKTMPSVSESKYTDYTSISSIPRLVISLLIGSSTSYSVDLTKRFESSLNYCPITKYSITKVLDGSKSNATVSYTVYSNLFELNQTSGVFKIKDFTTPISKYYIYLQAENSDGAKGGDSDYLIDYSITNKTVIVIDTPPSFNYDPGAITVNVNEGSQASTSTVKLPGVSTDTQSIKISNSQSYPYLSVDFNSGTLIINQAQIKKADEGVKKVELTLTDDTGKTTSYTVAITINYFTKSVEVVPQ